MDGRQIGRLRTLRNCIFPDKIPGRVPTSAPRSIQRKLTVISMQLFQAVFALQDFLR